MFRMEVSIFLDPINQLMHRFSCKISKISIFGFVPENISVKIRIIILFLTVSKNKIAATPENIGVVAILTVVLNYSILFPSFTFFLDGFHLDFGDKFEICIKTTDLM